MDSSRDDVRDNQNVEIIDSKDDVKINQEVEIIYSNDEVKGDETSDMLLSKDNTEDLEKFVLSYPKESVEYVGITIFHIIKLAITLIACFSGPALFFYSKLHRSAQLSQLQIFREEINNRRGELVVLGKYIEKIYKVLDEEDLKHADFDEELQENLLQSIKDVENAFNFFFHYDENLRRNYTKLSYSINGTIEKALRTLSTLEEIQNNSTLYLTIAHQNYITHDIARWKAIVENDLELTEDFSITTCKEKMKKETEKIPSHQLLFVLGKYVRVYCYVQNNRPWMVFQHRNQYRSPTFSDLSYQDYQIGFGFINMNFFIGLDFLHIVTQLHNFTVSFDQVCDDYAMQIVLGWSKFPNSGSQRYSGFKVGPPSSRYALSIGGTIDGQDISYFRDTLKRHPEFVVPDYSATDFILACRWANNHQGFWLHFACPVQRTDRNYHDYRVSGNNAKSASSTLLTKCHTRNRANVYSDFNMRMALSL